MKSKRQVLRTLKDKIRANFNVSVSEVGYQDKWQRAELAVACIGSDKKYVNGLLNKINDLLRSCHRVQVIDSRMEMW